MPQLRGIVDPRVEQELNRTLERIYAYYDAKLKEVETKTGTTISARVRQEFGLFSAGLAAPLADGTSDELATVGTDKALEVSDVPNLPISKITGTLPLAQTASEVLLTPDNLTKTPGVFVITGKITITDNDGNTVDLLYT